MENRHQKNLNEYLQCTFEEKDVWTSLKNKYDLSSFRRWETVIQGKRLWTKA